MRWLRPKADKPVYDIVTRLFGLFLANLRLNPKNIKIFPFLALE